MEWNGRISYYQKVGGAREEWMLPSTLCLTMMSSKTQQVAQDAVNRIVLLKVTPAFRLPFGSTGSKQRNHDSMVAVTIAPKLQ